MSDNIKREAQTLLKNDKSIEVVYATEDGNLFLMQHYAQQHAKATGQEVIELKRKDLPFVKEKMPVATNLNAQGPPKPKKGKAAKNAKKSANKK